MNFKTQILSLTLLFTSLFITNIQAQNIQVVTPNNAAASASEIAMRFNGLINTPASDIENFYNSFFGQNYNTNCPSPDASITSMDVSQVSFGWSVLPGVDSTRIGLLRLSTGQIQGSVTHDNIITYNNLPNNELYLAVFQSKCGDDVSALEIIIFDKPIMYSFADNCLCDHYADEWSESIDANTVFVSNPWNAQNEYEKYQVRFFDSEGGIAAHMAFILKFEGLIPTSLAYLEDPDCLKNLSTSPDEAIFFVHDTYDVEDLLGTVTFATNASFSFVPTGFGNGMVKITRCLDAWQPRHSFDTNTPEQILVRPAANPFRGQTQISYSLSIQQHVSIFITDAYGHVVSNIQQQTLTEAGHHQFTVDLQNHPSGSYHCVLKTDESIVPIKLFKLD